MLCLPNSPVPKPKRKNKGIPTGQTKPHRSNWVVVLETSETERGRGEKREKGCEPKTNNKKESTVRYPLGFIQCTECQGQVCFSLRNKNQKRQQTTASQCCVGKKLRFLPALRTLPFSEEEEEEEKPTMHNSLKGSSCHILLCFRHSSLSHTAFKKKEGTSARKVSKERERERAKKQQNE